MKNYNTEVCKFVIEPLDDCKICILREIIYIFLNIVGYIVPTIIIMKILKPNNS